MKYIVTDKGPIDRNPVGSEVSSLYTQEVLDRLVAEGYVEAQEPAAKAKRRKKAKDGS